MKMQEINPASFKCGPDYIDPMFHKTVIGISSYNLDSFLCGENGVREILKKNGAGADISVMEGVMGYYDGIAGISSEASAYDIARITDTPAVMILDCKGLSVSAVPCIQGFLHYKEDSRIKGVILNRLSPMMYGRMKEMIEVQTGIKVYGYVPVMKDCALESRYLGLKLPKERKDTEDKLTRLGEQILKSVDIAGLLELAENAPELQEKEEPDTRLVGQEPYDGVLYYVQIGFLGSRKPLNDKVFKSYRNRVTEKREPGRGYRYLVGGVRDYDAIVKIQSEARKEFPDAFVVAYEGDKRIDVKTARRKTGQ